MTIGSQDLLIVGAGTLGKQVALQWHAKHPEARIVGETITTRAHDSLRAHNIIPRTRADGAKDETIFPHVLFCAPPSDDYAADAARCAARVSNNGRLVFTSSTSVFVNNPEVSEDSPLSDSPRATRIISAEREILNHKGTVLRLAGLYDASTNVISDIRSGVSWSTPHAVLNLVHYADAARAVVSALGSADSRLRGAALIVCDGCPITVLQTFQHCLRLPQCNGREMPKFQGLMPPLRKRCDNSHSRHLLGWSPVYSSFEKWVESCLTEGAGSALNGAAKAVRAN